MSLSSHGSSMVLVVFLSHVGAVFSTLFDSTFAFDAQFNTELSSNGTSLLSVFPQEQQPPQSHVLFTRQQTQCRQGQCKFSYWCYNIVPRKF